MFKITITFIVFLFLGGCSDVSGTEDTVESLENEIEVVNKEKEKLSEENEKLTEEIKNLKTKIENSRKEYQAYKKKMEPYEELEIAEAESRKAEADKRAKEEKAEAERVAKEEKEKKAAAEKAAAEKKAAEKAAAEKEKEEKEAQGYETGITFDQLARTPDDYTGEKIKFSGKVVQVIEGTGEIQLRFAVNDAYDQMIYLSYFSYIVDQRVLEDDFFTVYGVSLGTISYESTFGATITIPAALIDRIDFN